MNKLKRRESPYSKKESCYKKINAKSGQKILENIRKLYLNSKSNQKSNILTIVSNLFSRKYLNKIGFSKTQNIYKTSIRKAEKEEFNLKDYKRHKLMSKLKKSNEMINDVIKNLEQYFNWFWKNLL